MREFHPYANLFPLIEGDALTEFTASIEKNGLQQKIVLHRDGRILDGRNREIACEKTGAKPDYETFETDAETRGEVVIDADYDAAALVKVMAQLQRRELNTFQRAEVAEKYEALFAVEAEKRMKAGKATSTKISHEDNRSASRAAKVAGISPTSFKKAKKVKKEATPEVVDAVRKGEKSIDAALKVVEKTKTPKAPKPTPSGVYATLLDDAAGLAKTLKRATAVAESFTTKQVEKILADFAKVREGQDDLRKALKQATTRRLSTHIPKDSPKGKSIAAEFGT